MTQPAHSSFSALGAEHRLVSLGRPLEAGAPHIIWAHGWGQSHHAFTALAGSLERVAHHSLVDFPGFGASPPPPQTEQGAWDTACYADAIADWLRTLPRGQRIWVGHSFGGRVGLRLAVRHPDAVDAMVLVGTHGVRPHRSLAARVRLFLKVRLFKALKLLERLGVDVSARKAKFGSSDYRNAGVMRPVFVKVVAEDQSPDLGRITIPVRLVYGALDNQTPPELGQRIASLIPGATMMVLPGLDHYTVLSDGGPQIVHALSQLLER